MAAHSLRSRGSQACPGARMTQRTPRRGEPPAPSRPGGCRRSPPNGTAPSRGTRDRLARWPAAIARTDPSRSTRPTGATTGVRRSATQQRATRSSPRPNDPRMRAKSSASTSARTAADGTWAAERGGAAASTADRVPGPPAAGSCSLGAPGATAADQGVPWCELGCVPPGTRASVPGLGVPPVDRLKAPRDVAVAGIGAPALG